MDHYRVIIMPRAGNDLEKIYDYIAADSPEHAAGMIRKILDAIEQLKQFPRRRIMERQSPKLKHPVRNFVVKPYIVYFRILEGETVVRVLHVRHGARRQPRRFGA